MQPTPLRVRRLHPVVALVLALLLPACAGGGHSDGYFGGAPMVQAALSRLPPGPLTCVPFARELSGVRLNGDAHTWWNSAPAHGYARGAAPRPGAVLVFARAGRLSLGHVSVVTHRAGAREILVTHANWGDTRATRGRIDQDVRVVDVSARNDWTLVRVWHAPSGQLGITSYRTHGFIYGPSDTSQAELSEAVERAAWAAHESRPGQSVERAPRLAMTGAPARPARDALPLPPRRTR